MKVQNITNNNGNKVANQFIVDGEHRGQAGRFFQSYNSVIAFVPANGSSISLDGGYWDFSKTTSKYRNKFLNETTQDTKRKIASGEYILTDLN